MENSNEPMYVEWVVGRAVGDRAKSIIDHANAGLSYFIMEQGKQGNQTFCLYAFRRPMDSPVPDHLTRVVDPFQQKKLDDRYDARHGIDKRPQERKPIDPQKIKAIKDIFYQKKGSHNANTSQAKDHSDNRTPV